MLIFFYLPFIQLRQTNQLIISFFFGTDRKSCEKVFGLQNRLFLISKLFFNFPRISGLRLHRVETAIPVRVKHRRTRSVLIWVNTWKYLLFKPDYEGGLLDNGSENLKRRFEFQYQFGSLYPHTSKYSFGKI